MDQKGTEGKEEKEGRFEVGCVVGESGVSTLCLEQEFPYREKSGFDRRDLRAE